MILALAACSGPSDGVERPSPAPTADTGPAPCGPTGVERAEPRCDQGALALLAFTTGCADRVAVDLWEDSLRHERHPLERVTAPGDGGATWSLGAVLMGVEPADWSPGSASAVPCEALGEVTFALEVEVAGEGVRCLVWGPRAAEIGALPGAPAVCAD